MIRRLRPSRRAALFTLVCCLSVTAMVGSGTAFATTGQIKEFRIPSRGYGPLAIATGSDGALWFTDVGNAGIERLGPHGFSLFTVPHPGFSSDIVAGPDGALWFTVGLRIGRITTDGHTSDFALPPCAGCGQGDAAMAITVGPDHNLWYTRPSESVIGRITPTGRIKEFPIGGVESQPTWLTTGPDGALWFTDSSGIGRMTLGGSVSQPWSGLNYPSSITTGPDGDLWVTGASQDVVAQVTTKGKGELYALDLNCDPQWIAPGAGSLWVACYNLNEISRVSTTGKVTNFRVPGHLPNYPDVLSGVVQGKDGAMWFTEYAGERIGRLSV